MNHGGSRPGAGRKPKEERDRIRDLSINALDAIFGSPQEAINHIAHLAKAGSFPHLKLLMEYAYGRPRQMPEPRDPFDININVTDAEPTVLISEVETWADRFRTGKPV